MNRLVTATATCSVTHSVWRTGHLNRLPVAEQVAEQVAFGRTFGHFVMTLVKMDGKLSTKQHDIAFQMKVFACKNSEFLRVPMKGAHKSLQQFATLQFATLATMHHGAARQGIVRDGCV